MPLYDRICRACGWLAVDTWEAISVDPLPCPTCGTTTERAWLTKSSTVIGDECDFVQHNGTKEPIRFRSRSEFRRWCHEHSYRVKDSHVPEQGSDKSKHTSNWGQSYDPYTAENVRILIERTCGEGRDTGDAPIEKVPFQTGDVADLKPTKSWRELFPNGVNHYETSYE